MNDIKKQVKKQLSKYSNEKYLNEYIKNEFLTDNGDANIFIKLEDEEELFDDRTVGNQLELNNMIYDYLDEKSSILNSNIRLNLHIIGLDLKDDKKKLIKSLIKEHYAIELYKAQKEFKDCKKKIFSLLMLGVITLIFYILIFYNTKLGLIEEIIAFISSFSIWIAFENFIYDYIDIKHEREKITQKLLLDINFGLDE